MGPAGQDGRDGLNGAAGPAGQNGLVNIATASQTAVVSTSRDYSLNDFVWVPVPGLVANINLPDSGTLDLFASGSLEGTGQGNNFCAFRFVVDGVPQGGPDANGNVAGQRLVGLGRGAGDSNLFWLPWSLMENVAVAGGAHVVSLEIASVDKLCKIAAADFFDESWQLRPERK